LPLWRNYFCIGLIFFKKKSPNDLGGIFAKKKLVGRLFGSFGDFSQKHLVTPTLDENVDTFNQKHFR
jgi:hypothetical protein